MSQITYSIEQWFPPRGSPATTGQLYLDRQCDKTRTQFNLELSRRRQALAGKITTTWKKVVEIWSNKSILKAKTGKQLRQVDKQLKLLGGLS